MSDEQDDEKALPTTAPEETGETEKSAAAASESEAPKAAAAKPEKSSPWPSKRKSVAPPPNEATKSKAASEKPAGAEPVTTAAVAPGDEWPKAAWGERLFVLDKKWTKLEARLLWWVLAAEIFALVFTVLISGLATDPGNGANSGIVLRSAIGALVLGGVAYRVMRDRERREIVVTIAVLVGLFLGPRWANTGVAYFGNVRNWLQNASILLLVGGVSQLAKRLTLWLALLGASVATAQGKHINVDVVMRFLSPKARVPVAVIGWLAAALVSFASVIAFFDELAIADYRARDQKPCVTDPQKSCETSEGERISEMSAVIRRDLFLLGRQASLDVKSFPKILSGVRYDDFLTAQEWNAWMKGGGWESYYPKADVDSLQLPEDGDAKRSPAIVVPGAVEKPEELLMRELDLIVPFGLFMIALRFVLRALLALSGWIKVDPNAAHADDHEDDERDAKKAAKSGGAA